MRFNSGGLVPLRRTRPGLALCFAWCALRHPARSYAVNGALTTPSCVHCRTPGDNRVRSAVLSDIWGLEIAPTRDVAVAKIEAMRQKFARLERDFGDGPWFAGEPFGLVDAVFGPVFRYFDLFDRLLDHRIFTDKPKVTAWRAALAERPSIRQAVVADYALRLERFVAKQNGYLAALLAKRAA
jgi:hypothetical protein